MLPTCESTLLLLQQLAALHHVTATHPFTACAFQTSLAYSRTAIIAKLPWCCGKAVENLLGPSYAYPGALPFTALSIAILTCALQKVTNDDGPPSAQSSPYILPFVRELERSGHTVSVIVPHTQRSWIGKAHMVGQDVQAVHYWPPKNNPEEHSESASASDDGRYPWVLVNSTPASCSQLGLSHFFEDRGKVDLVVSGPNYGRNTSSLFAMSSGTLGAAFEATQCGQRSVALSFAFFDRINDPEVVAESCQQSVRIVEWLANHAKWGDSVLYSVNVPVKKGVLKAKVHWTRVLQNTWNKGACFAELPKASSVDDGNAEEARLRRQESSSGPDSGSATPTTNKWATRHFKWAPRFSDVYQSVEKAGPGWDGWVVKEGEVSVTALKANFMHAETSELDIRF